MSSHLIFLSIMLIVIAFTVISYYFIVIGIAKSKVGEDYISKITQRELHISKSMILPRAFLYMLVFLTYKDISRNNDLTIAELRDVLIKYEGIPNDDPNLPVDLNAI